MLNCTALDETFKHARTFMMDHPHGNTIAVISLTLVGFVLIVFGERIVRTLGGALGGIFALIPSYIALGYISLECETRLIVCGIVSMVFACAFACLLNYGIFLIGSTSLGMVTHLTYDALPRSLTDAAAPFEWMGRSGYYYIAMAIAVVGGGILAYTQKTRLLQMMSSTVGAGSIVLASDLVSLRVADDPLPPLAAIAILTTFTVSGTVYQQYRKERRKRRATS
jgi:hypothetical protein